MIPRSFLRWGCSEGHHGAAALPPAWQKWAVVAYSELIVTLGMICREVLWCLAPGALNTSAALTNKPQSTSPSLLPPSFP